MARTPTLRQSIWMDSPERYGLVSRALHWCMAYLLLWQFGIILSWRVFGPSDLLKAITSLGPYHGTVGLLTIILVVFRFGWALFNRKRRPPRGSGWSCRAALAGHVGLYTLMFAIPALGLLRAYGNGKGWKQWDLQVVPATGEEIGWMTAPADALHGILSWTLFALIVGHIAMTLHHRFIRCDSVLARMAGPLRASGDTPNPAPPRTKEASNVA